LLAARFTVSYDTKVFSQMAIIAQLGLTSTSHFSNKETLEIRITKKAKPHTN